MFLQMNMLTLPNCRSPYTCTESKGTKVSGRYNHITDENISLTTLERNYQMAFHGWTTM